MKYVLLFIAIVCLFYFFPDLDTNVTPPQKTVDTTRTARAESPDVQTMCKVVGEVESHNNTRARRFEPHVFARLHATNERSAYRDSLLSTSWGKFQILGSNFRKCGYNDVITFVVAMKRSEQAQDSAFVTFVRNVNIEHLFHARKWESFARCYNGAAYKRNKYSQKLAQIYSQLTHKQNG